MYTINPHKKKQESCGKYKSYIQEQKLNFLPARLMHTVSGFPVGSHSGREVVTNCDGRKRHNGERYEISN
jgi:hypothetical protein